MNERPSQCRILKISEPRVNTSDERVPKEVPRAGSVSTELNIEHNSAGGLKSIQRKDSCAAAHKESQKPNVLQKN